MSTARATTNASGLHLVYGFDPSGVSCERLGSGVTDIVINTDGLESIQLGQLMGNERYGFLANKVRDTKEVALNGFVQYGSFGRMRVIRTNNCEFRQSGYKYYKKVLGDSV